MEKLIFTIYITFYSDVEVGAEVGHALSRSGVCLNDHAHFTFLWGTWRLGKAMKSKDLELLVSPKA